MWKVTGEKCLQEGCDKNPTYNYINIKGNKYCAKHALPGMINRSKISSFCQEDGCTTIANFNYLGEKKGKFCVKHKKDEMINVVDSKCIENY